MDFRCAVLFACIALAYSVNWRWTTRMIVKNPENNPPLNLEQLGTLQNAWKSIQNVANGTFVLVFRSFTYDAFVRCVYLTANITDVENKTANYTITYYNTMTKNSTNFTFQVMALTQADYSINNVIRLGLNGTSPRNIPFPEGSNTYVQYNNRSCSSSGHPFVDKASDPPRRNRRVQENELEESDQDKAQRKIFGRAKADYLDLYVVYSQPTCNILRVGEGKTLKQKFR
ncbi:unnamed protein product [Ixodes hexagonus]